MRRFALSCAAAIALAGPAPAADCTAEVTAAFDKQRKAPAFRMVADMTGEQGATKMTVDYLPPDRMHQTVERADMPAPLETIAVSNRAWGNMGGGFEELLPQFAQGIIAGVRQALVDPPEKMSAFTCLGAVTFEGRELTGYRSEPPAGTAADQIVDRTLYVDPATGLPVYNVVGARKEGTPPLFKGAYTYPTDIVIDAIEGAPVAANR